MTEMRFFELENLFNLVGVIGFIVIRLMLYTEYIKMKYFCILILVGLFPLQCFSQGDYIFYTDSTASYGVKLIDGGSLMNSKLCRLKKGERIIEYTPNEIKEFGFKNGQVYISKEIKIADSQKKVFLERLHSGNMTLYYYRRKGIKTFFVQKDSTLFVEIPKSNTAEDDYSEQLMNLTQNCPAVLDACRFVNYNKKSLTKLVKRYNRCEKRPFPRFRYGLLVGYEISKLIPSDKQNEDLGNFDYKYDGGFSYSVFIDKPILVSDFSLHAELLFSKHSYSYNTLTDNRDLDFVANFTTLNVPFLLRYAYPSNKIRAFMNIGVSGTYFVKNETLLYETNISETTIEINDTKSTAMVSDFQLGFVVGSGLEYKLNYKHSLFFEFRYNSHYNMEDSKFLGASGFSFLTGIYF